MALQFAYNFCLNQTVSSSISYNYVRFFPFTLNDYISLNTVNIPGIIAGYNGGGDCVVYHIGLYSLTGSTLTVLNSATAWRRANNSANGYFGADGFVASNVSPGNYWFGFYIMTSVTGTNTSYTNTTMCRMYGNTIAGNDIYPGAFFVGSATVSTTALPASTATSDLDITGTDAIFIPAITISA